MTLRVSIEEIVATDRTGLLGIHPTWRRIALSEVAQVQNGFAFKSETFSRDRGVPLLRIRDVGGNAPKTLIDDDVDPEYIVNRGDIVIGMDGDFRAARWAGPPSALNQRVCRVGPTATNSYDTRFLFHALQPYLDAVHRATSAITVKHLSSRTVGELPLPLPPLAEQRRIVEAIEEAFSKLDAGEAGLQKVRQLLKRLRDAVLAAAATGRLVPQDPTDIPADKLLEELGVQPLAGVPVPHGWARSTVGDLLARIEAGKSFASLGRPAGGDEIGVIKVSAMTWGHFRPEENKAIPLGSVVDEPWMIRQGDLLFSRANTSEYVGACVLVPRDYPNLILSDKSLRLVPSKGVDPRWLQIYLRSRPARLQIEVLATGTKQSMRNISQAKLRGIEVTVPPAKETERIIAEVERQMSFIDACERAVDAGLVRSAALRRSVLKAAFEGRLVPQDPTDEPASVLLDRLRAERETAPKPPRRRRKAAS